MVLQVTLLTSDITDRIVELDKALASFQITADNTNVQYGNNQKGRKDVLHIIRQKKSEGENIVTDIIT